MIRDIILSLRVILKNIFRRKQKVYVLDTSILNKRK